MCSKTQTWSRTVSRQSTLREIMSSSSLYIDLLKKEEPNLAEPLVCLNKVGRSVLN
jgi:hypothetical protein